MRRKQGVLRPIEAQILTAALHLRARGEGEFHGFLIAKEMAQGAQARTLTAQGTLYRALARLTADGLLVSAWEDPAEAAQAGRPMRRLYRLTPDGVRATTAAGRTVAGQPRLQERPA